MPLPEIENIFSDPCLADSLRIINITGGEPTLREDLSGIVKILLRYCRSLKQIDISTNGVNTEQIVDQIERALAIILPVGIKLNVNISLDGVGQAHEQIRGVPGIFNDLQRTIEELKELRLLYPYFSIGLNMTVGKLNYDAVSQVFQFSQDKDIGLNFTLAAVSEIGVESVKMRERFEMDQEQKDKALLSLEGLSRKGCIDPQYRDFLFRYLREGRRSNGCLFRERKAYLLEPDGNLYSCGNFKEFKLGNLREDNFSNLYRNTKNIPESAWRRCSHCASNCYYNQKV